MKTEELFDLGVGLARAHAANVQSGSDYRCGVCEGRGLTGGVCTHDPFMIDSVDRLGWYGRKLAAKQAEIDALKVSYQELMAKLSAELDEFKSHFEPQAVAFAQEELLHRGGKSKFIDTLGGRFQFRTVKGGPRVVDRIACRDWAIEHLPEAIKTEPTLVGDVVRDHIKATGEVPPGVEIADDRESFSWSVGKGVD